MGGLVNQPAFINTFNNPGPTMVGLIVSLYEGTAIALKITQTFLLKTSIIVGCFFGCIAAFSFGENLGRRWSLAIGAIIMVVGALLQCKQPLHQ